MIITNLCATLADIDHLKACWRASQGDDATGRTLKSLDKKETSLAAQKKRLIDAITAGVIDFSDAREKKTELDTQLQKIKADRGKLLATQSAPLFDALDRDEFDQFDRDTQRQILATALKRIELRHNSIKLTYAFPITLEGATMAVISIPDRFTRQPK